MSRKDVLLRVIETGRNGGETLISRIAPEDREAEGTFETWSSKDAIAHVAEWLLLDLKKLDTAERPIPAVTRENVEDKNRAIFEKHSGKSWDEIVEFFRTTFDDAHRRVEQMSDADVNAEYEYSDGSSRSNWQMIAGHALMHLAPHFALVCRRIGDSDAATDIVERTAKVIVELDDSPKWRGTVTYNLACHYSLSGDRAHAIELLREAAELNPGLVEWLKKDEDLDPIRTEPGFAALLVK